MKAKRLIVSDMLLFALLRDGRKAIEIIHDPVPEDAEIRNVRQAWPTGIELLIASDSFEEIEEGQEIPILQPQSRALETAR